MSVINLYNNIISEAIYKDIEGFLSVKNIRKWIKLRRLPK